MREGAKRTERDMRTSEQAAEDRLDALCRSALQAYRLDTFDNVNVAASLTKDRLSGDDARWIARHLMANARSLSGYKAGQVLLAEASHAG